MRACGIIVNYNTNANEFINLSCWGIFGINLQKNALQKDIKILCNADMIPL